MADRKIIWAARYQHHHKFQGQRRIDGTWDEVASTRLAECPTSFITPDTRWLLQEYFAVRLAHGEFGAVKYGSDPDQWPAWWFDTVETLALAKHEEDKIKNSE